MPAALMLMSLFLAFLPGEAASGEAKPLEVYILAGQSNMQGHAHVRTFDAMGLSEPTAALLREMVDENGSPRVVEDVWISSLGSSAEERSGPLTAGFGAEAGGPKIGPEFTFGIRMRKSTDRPILIIKTAWGGKSLHTDFRPPSAGPYELNERERQKAVQRGEDLATTVAKRRDATGRYYRAMIEHVEKVLSDPKRYAPAYDAKAGYVLAGFVWFQGWNDMVDGDVYPNRDKPGGYSAYSDVLTHFIRDVRKDLDAPGLPFVIGVLGVGGPTSDYGPAEVRYKSTHQGFRDAMAAPAKLPEFQGNTIAVPTERYWDREYRALRSRETQSIGAERAKLDAALKAGEISREARAAKLEELDRMHFDARERKILRESTSNGEYHYLGSARILAPIGNALAEAMIELRKRPDTPEAARRR
ncbi:MAG: sialate O-acetylesterase [Isosphaeraceae bacterium]|nr:sialate O-acetylesterase [Isosphaeraceae bacterium]